jgi:TonB family protein
MIQKPQTTLALLTSIALHFLLISSAYIHFPSRSKVMSLTSPFFFPTYLMLDSTPSASTKKIFRQNLKKDHSFNNKSSNQVSGSVNSDNMMTDKLRRALHAAIAAQQVYPASAPTGLTTARTKITFLLYPDGHIENANIAQSSGSTAFDFAALDAVESARLDPTLTQSLRSAKTFFIDIIFARS